MFDFGKIKFIQEYEDGQKIVHEIRGDASMDEVVDAFELFLKGAGYHLPDGTHIGYEYEGECSKKEWDAIMPETDRIDMTEMHRAIDEMVDMEDSMLRGDPGHSKYYYIKDRNS